MTNNNDMTEHQKLKWICNTIGYSIYNWWNFWFYENKLVKNLDFWEDGVAIVNVREIIFTPEFIEKLYKYVASNIEIRKKIVAFKSFSDEIMEHLDYPVEYLYNLLKND